MGDGCEMLWDTYGNVIYWAMMADFGIHEDNAVYASHANTAATGDPDARDNFGIHLGYQLQARYPNGATQDEFIAFLFSSDTLMAFESQQKVRTAG
jgi:hypothetical protein